MIQELFTLAGKTILITGSSRGIGFALAQGLGKAGATIILNGRNRTTLETASARLRDFGITVHESVFDVSDEGGINKGIDIVESEIGSIDVLFNNAGI